MDLLPRLLLKFNDGVSGKHFEDEEVNVDEYIGVKSYKAKGKRLSVHDVNYYEFLEPFAPPVVEEEFHAEKADISEMDENNSHAESSEEEMQDADLAENSDNTDVNEEDDNKEGQLTLF